MKWDSNGVRGFKTYNVTDDSFRDCERIWTAYYGKFPGIKLASKWTGQDRAKEWLRTVNQVYYSL